jgi:hypothetical protein
MSQYKISILALSLSNLHFDECPGCFSGYSEPTDSSKQDDIGLTQQKLSISGKNLNDEDQCGMVLWSMI